MKSKANPQTPETTGALVTTSSATLMETSFSEVVRLIQASRQSAVQAVNTVLIDLYWQIGEYLHHKIVADGWAKGTVTQLAAYIAERQPGLRGFSASNLWRMRQFFETYRDQPILATLLRELAWSSHLHILARAKRPDERKFYLRLATQHHWTVRELVRQMDGGLFERTALNPPQVSTALRALHPEPDAFFKDAYLLEFLDLPSDHSEADLHSALVRNLSQFLIELGRDYCYIGSEYPIQVGGQDFAIDLLFFHRGLNSLLAIELKVTEFRPEHLGKLNFYLEALDRDVRKSHEQPAIGVLLCATKDTEVVEYALSRSLSPAVIAEYQTRLPDKRMLQSKLHEFYALNAPNDPAPLSATPSNARQEALTIGRKLQ